MGLLDIFKRSSIENPSVPLSSDQAFSVIFGETASTGLGFDITVDKALSVPAVWAAVNFISNTIGSLPLQVYRTDSDGNPEIARTDPVYTLLHDTVNQDYLTSFKWRKQVMTQVLTNGRDFTYVERNKANRVVNLWRLDPSTVTVRRETVADIPRTFYDVTDKSGNRRATYDASEIIDISFILKSDGLSHRSPIVTLKNTIALAIAMENYGSKFFNNGGVPPLVLEGPPASPGAVRRGTAQIEEAVRRAMQENKNVLYMPANHKLIPIAFKPEDGQMQEARLYQLQEIARIYSLPPVFLQDLSNGTYTNSEQQDLHFVKHTLGHWLEQWEQEMNAKLFGPRRNSRYVEFNIDGLLRGDFKTRMDGYAQAIQNGLMTPDEARALENRPPKGGNADKLLVNSASLPLDSLGEETVEQQPPQQNPSDGDIDE